MKDAEQETSNVVQAIQNLSTNLQKSKEAYLSRSQEVEKLRKENGGPKDIERAETRLKKAAEDYRAQVEKYAAMRLDFERKMTNSSQHFQDLEEQHLQQMLEFANSYTKALEFDQQSLAEVRNSLLFSKLNTLKIQKNFKKKFFKSCKISGKNFFLFGNLGEIFFF